MGRSEFFFPPLSLWWWELTIVISLAYHEMRLILANTLWHFDLELCPESKNWQDQRVYIIWEKQPLMCKLKPAKRE